jgi:hypothetical protein
MRRSSESLKGRRGSERLLLRHKRLPIGRPRLRRSLGRLKLPLKKTQGTITTLIRPSTVFRVGSIRACRVIWIAPPWLMYDISLLRPVKMRVTLHVRAC